MTSCGTCYPDTLLLQDMYHTKSIDDEHYCETSDEHRLTSQDHCDTVNNNSFEDKSADEERNKNIVEEEKCASTEKEMEDYLEDFSLWMSSISGGQRAQKTIDSYAHAARIIMQAIGGIQNLDSKLNEIGNSGGFLEVQCQEKSVSTVRTYIFGLCHFLRFLAQSPRCPVTKEVCHSKINDSTRWLRLLRKKLAEQKQDIKQRDSILIEQLKSHAVGYWKSEHAKTAASLLEDFEPNQIQLVSDILHVRDFIITQILLKNGQRPGTIKNMQMKDVYNRELLQGPLYAIKVSTISVAQYYQLNLLYYEQVPSRVAVACLFSEIKKQARIESTV